MGLKDILQKRVSRKKNKTQEQEVVDWLNNKAGEIMKLTAEHLKYVNHVLKEFDCHDVTHSEKVLEIIEEFLGNKAKDLSSYNLFLLIAVSYLHDCGMAVSDYELKILKMVERNLDHEKQLSQDEAEAKIKSRRKSIYGSFKNGEIKNWLFVPKDENTLISYFAKLLRGYQTYRHGRIDEIDVNSSNSRAKSEINKKIRIDYLRISHHERIEDYVKNWGETFFMKFPKPGIAQKLADDIAKCCRAHGEDASYIIKEFEKNTSEKYYGLETSNLQFVAMMLRLGDIIHFSYDRAHPVLRALHIFESEYSLQQWTIKANGLSFNVFDGFVSCIALCQTPKVYYDLWSYVDYIDHELGLYNELSLKWEKTFQTIKIKEKVDRSGIGHDACFDPEPGLKFTMDQNKILELLMGEKLYTNEYACLRELYQNSMDACRCQIAIAKNKDSDLNPNPAGRIEFGLGEERDRKSDEVRKYVYCLDNGKGMTKDIIKRFLLHIGSSYYRSPEFFQMHSKTRADFTPTSQFGIGMLSCFMIGDEIEITTHEEGKDVISCVMEHKNEYFYYKKPSQTDADKVRNSGTYVKVFLNKKYQSLLNDDPLNNLGYLLWYNETNPKDIIKKDLDRWEHNIYRIMNDFILMVPNNIKLLISLRNPIGNKETFKIFNKPLPINSDLQNHVSFERFIDNNDKTWLNQLMEGNNLEIIADVNGLKYRTILEVGECVHTSRKNIRLNYCGRICVDGIVIRDTIRNGFSLLNRLISQDFGILNFYGSNRPQLSVNRDDVINKSLKDYDLYAPDLLEALINKSITEVCVYIKENDIPSYLYNEIWHRLFKKYDFCINILYNSLKATEICHDMLMPFHDVSIDFCSFLIADKILIPRKETKNDRKYPFMQLLLLRLLESKDIKLNNENELVLLGHDNMPEYISDAKRINILEYYFCPSHYDTYWKEYDLVQFAKFRLISDELKSRMKNMIDNTVGKCHFHENHVYIEEKIIKKFKKALSREIRKHYPTGISRESNKIEFIVIDDFKLDKIHDFIYNVVGDTILWLMFNSALSFKGSLIDIHYSGLTLYIHNKSLLLLIEMDRDQKYRKICFARRGKCTRQEILNAIPQKWKKRIRNILFIDGTLLSPE